MFNHQRCEFESRSWRGLLDAALCDNVCQCLTAGRWLSPGTPVFSTNNTDRHDITEILLKVALNTIILNPPPIRMTYIRMIFVLMHNKEDFKKS